MGIFLPSFKLTVEFGGITVAWINQHKPLRSYFLHMINAPLKVTLSGHAAAAYGFLSGGGETGEQIRSFDWESSPVGPVEGWSQSLKTCIRLLLTSPHPMFLWWGSEAVYFYNDAMIALLGDLHPGSLGRPAAQGWGDLWDQLEPQFSSLMASGMLAADRPLLQVMRAPDLSYHFNGSLVPGDTGDMAGVMAVGAAVSPAAPPRFVKTDISGYTSELLKHFEGTIRKAGLTLVVNIQPVSEEVYVDRHMWEMILFTLLSNALRYTLSGGIAVRLSQEGDLVQLSVSDSGAGMSASLLAAVRETLLHNDDGNSGITLINKLVARHGGQLQVDSTAGAGSHFLISIPTGKTHLPADEVMSASGAVVYRYYQEFLPEMEFAPELPKNELQPAADPAAIYTLAAIVESSDDAIISKTLDGVITSWNPAAEKLFGFTAAEMIGEVITRIIPADRMEEEPRIIAKLRAGERVDHFETKRLTKSGGLVDISLTISPVKDIEGNIVGASKIARDITGQRRLFAALKESEAKYMQLALKLEALVDQRTRELLDANFYLEKSNRELEQFAYVTSHDLQEPLRKIHTFAGMLYNVNKEILSETSRMYIDKVMFSARRMSQLINELLDYSRLVHVKDPFVETDLNEILKNVLTDYEVTIDRHDVQLELGELPRLLVSPLQMNQLFHNLLGNALKFLSPDRKPLIKVYAQLLPAHERAVLQDLDPEKDYYMITIKDNGIGFEQMYAAKIFQIFQRLNERTAFEGTGIGLALCSKIVLNHKGAIYANGVPDEGAEFNVILPVSA